LRVIASKRHATFCEQPSFTKRPDPMLGAIGCGVKG